MIGAWLTGALWGAVSVVIAVESDPFVQFLLIVCQTAFVAGGTVRNCSVPIVAQGQAMFASAPLVLACLASEDLFYRLFSVFAVFHIVTTRIIIRAVHQQIMAVLLSNEEKTSLADELTEANRQLEEMAVTDPLTLLYNRRGFDVRLLAEWRRSKRTQTPLSLLLLDVDCFKLFNDHYGHQTGDLCLSGVSQGIAAATRRPGDIVARYGGEEFAVILPDTDEFGALHVAEQVRAAVEALAIPHAAYTGGVVTVSIGATTELPEAGTTLEDLIRQADEALYRSKHQGRNRVSFQVSRDVLAAA